MRYLVIVYIVLLELICGCQKHGRELNQTTNYTYVTGEGMSPKRVDYDILNGMAIAEGDILLGTVEEVEAARVSVDSKSARKGAIRIKSNRALWTGGQIPYAIDPALENQDRVIDALLLLERSTNLRFIERSNETDYVVFQQVEKGCFATVGRRGGRQTVNLEKNCSMGNTVHEVLHTAGLWHEQSRLDRDQFIKINWENIKEEHKHNFQQQLNDGLDVGEYDYDSIMHYGPFSFSSNGKPTIVKLDGSSAGLGNRSQLSKKDIAALREIYQE